MVKVHTLTWNLHKRVDFCYEVTVKPRLTYKQHTYKELSQVKFCNIQLKYWCVANAHTIPPVKGFHPLKNTWTSTFGWTLLLHLVLLTTNSQITTIHHTACFIHFPKIKYMYYLIRYKVVSHAKYIWVHILINCSKITKVVSGRTVAHIKGVGAWTSCIIMERFITNPGSNPFSAPHVTQLSPQYLKWKVSCLCYI